MKAHLVLALAFTSLAATAFLIGPTAVAPATAATNGKPLQLNSQKSTTHKSTTKKVRKKSGKSARTPKAAAPASAQTQGDDLHASDRTAPETAGGSDMPLPVTMVRTTRIVNGEEIGEIPVVSKDEFNELDRIAAAPPLLVATIVHYLGGPAITDEADAGPTQATGIGGEARAAFASGAAPAEKPHGIALQYVLMTFGGALAAAAAARRLFAA
jgi:hypothetical protein